VTAPARRCGGRCAAVLVVILALALGLRLHGLTWGLPDDAHLFSYHPDEYFSLMAVWSFCFGGGDLNPHYFNYGTLYFYLVLFVAILAGHTDFSPDSVLVQHIAPPMRSLVLDARLTTVVLAVLTVLFVFLAAREVFGTRAGLLAGLVLAVAPLHVVQGHYATVDVPMTFWLVVCLYGSARALSLGREAASLAREDDPAEAAARKSAWRRVVGLYALAGLAAGLAGATKYNGGLAILFPLTAWVVGARERARANGSRAPLPWACLGACVACAAAGFVVGCPYALLAPHEWWGSIDTFQGVSYELHHMKVGEHPAVEAWPNGYAFHILGSLAYGLGWPLLIVLLGSLAYACYRRANGDWLIVPFILLWYLMIGAAKVRYMRYAMPLVPMLAVLGGRLCSEVALMRRPASPTRWLRAGGPLIVGVLILLAEIAALLQAVAYSGPGASRPALLKQAGVAAGDSVGLIWSPWFPHPPVAYVNGGAVLNRHPVWREFARSPYDVRVVGYAPDEADLPEFLVTTRFEVRDARKADTAEWRSIDGALRQHYRLVAEEQLGRRWLGRFGPPLEDAPADWLYPFPGIRIYCLQPGRDGTEKDSPDR
jgi:hypothetical protein